MLLLAAPLVVVTVLTRRLPRVPRRRLAVALAVFLLGAVGVEGLSGLLVRSTDEVTSLLRMVVFGLMVLEESLEMLGSALAVAAVVGHLRAAGVLRRPSDAMLAP